MKKAYKVLLEIFVKFKNLKKKQLCTKRVHYVKSNENFCNV